MIRSILILGCCLAAACTPKQIARTPASPGELIFQTGFEGDSRLVYQTAESAGIQGTDHSLPARSNWVEDLDNHPNIGRFNIQFGAGDSTQRYARIVEEPGKPQNHVLQFWLHEPTVNGSNGRIQGNLYGNNNLREFYQQERIFLPPDFNTVKQYPHTIHWLTIAEFWNNITWSQTVPYRFRITLGLGKQTEREDDLHFIVDAEDCELFADGKQRYSTVWAEVNKAVAVPIGKWFTLEYYFKEGSEQTGRFYMAITPEGGSRQVIFDVHRITHNTTDPHPDGLGDFNPIKLYTSKDLVDFVASRKQVLQVYWDDLKLWKNKRPQQRAAYFSR